MNKDYGIYIPSAGRAERQITVANLPDHWLERTTIVVPAGQKARYTKHTHVEVIECPHNTIGKTRQWIIDHCDDDYAVMMDDDLYFYHRAAPYEVKLIGNTKADNGKMLKTLVETLVLEDFVHAGVAPRTEASFFLCGHKCCTRINNVHAYNVKKMRRLKTKIGARFDRLELMEDFHVTLTLLEHGYPNKVLIDYVWNQPGSNTAGGCSTYRTAKAQAKAAHKLALLHPNVVKVVEKKVIGKTSWEGLKTRTDVRIQWHKAYSDAPHEHWATERKYMRK